MAVEPVELTVVLTESSGVPELEDSLADSAVVPSEVVPEYVAERADIRNCFKYVG